MKKKNSAKSTLTKSKKKKPPAPDENDDDDQSVGEEVGNLHLGRTGFSSATSGQSEILDSYIPCRFESDGCDRTFQDLTLADVHARFEHGEGGHV